ncbi:MAG: Acetyltransferase [Oscillospiraceae bacterium]|jgi:predicted N-acetyltransferase YhbS|nr:Acetyltransferase [Oscillospiraceae bacterium]
MNKNMTIRLETERDYSAVECLTRDAFWDVYKPGCDEHLVAHKLRHSKAFLPDLDYVAVQDGRIVGNIMYSVAQVINDGGCVHSVMTFGPLSVLPEFQGQGVGAALVRHTLAVAQKTGYPAIIIFGDPAYYHRFGFENARYFGITTSDGASFDAFMALELHDRALESINGRFYENDVFHIDPDELTEFEKAFPYREKHVTDTQLKF